VNLLNAHPGASAWTHLFRENDEPLNNLQYDSTPNGARECSSFHSSWQGKRLRMVTTFINANGAVRFEAMWIVV
jgi:hypothetical protein